MKKEPIIIFIIALFILNGISTIFLYQGQARDIYPTTPNHNHSFDLLIITSPLLKEELIALKNHKETYGIITKIVLLDEIKEERYFPLQGRDFSEQIKYFIKDAYDTWNISYVFFVGGQALIPLRRVETIPLHDVWVNFSSELYYADIYDENHQFSSWDADEDGLFCEWYNMSGAEDYKQDLKPEIAIGRIPCYQPDEVRKMVNKIIEYETNPADPSWFHTLVAAAGETFVEFEGLEGEVMAQDAIDVMEGFDPVRLWFSNDQLDKLGISILRAINKGCGFLYLVGHGNSNIWTTFNLEGKPITLFSSFHVPFLFNKGKYPVCILSGCHVCKIEKSLCLGWTLTKYQQKGAIVTIGPTNVGYLGFEYDGGGLDWIELQFFKEYMNGTRIVGDIWKQVLTTFSQTFPIDWHLAAGENCAIDAKMAQEWIIIGDPTLQIGGYQ